MTGEHLSHADSEKPAPKSDDSGDGKTIKDIVDSMTQDQKEVLYFLIAKAAEGEMKPGAETAPNKEGAPTPTSSSLMVRLTRAIPCTTPRSTPRSRTPSAPRRTLSARSS